jgi:membrane protein YqaA with SNARE-associated domain
VAAARNVTAAMASMASSLGSAGGYRLGAARSTGTARVA